MGWSRISPGFIIEQFEYIIIQCHDKLLNLINEETTDISMDIFIKRYEWLNAFISSSRIPPTEEILDIQERASLGYFLKMDIHEI